MRKQFDFRAYASSPAGTGVPAELEAIANADVYDFIRFEDTIDNVCKSVEGLHNGDEVDLLIDEALNESARHRLLAGRALSDEQTFALVLEAMARTDRRTRANGLAHDWWPESGPDRLDFVARRLGDKLAVDDTQNVVLPKGMCSYREMMFADTARRHFVIVSKTKAGTESEKLDTYNVSQYMEGNMNLLYVKPTPKDKPEMYIYDDAGYYREVSDTELKIRCRRVIDTHVKAPRLASPANVNEILGRCQMAEWPVIQKDDLNTDERFVNFQNGVLDLDTMELLPHSPELRSTIQVKTEWPEQDLPTPNLDAYLDTLTRGDKDAQAVLLETMGLALTNVDASRTKKVLLCVGLGDTGKSILLRITVDLLGSENVGVADLEQIASRFGMSAVYDKRICCNPDMGFQTVSSMSNLKQMSGSDQVAVEAKGKTPTNGHFRGVCWFIANDWPKFGGDKGDHMYERFIPLYFDNVIPKEERDRTLREKIMQEAPGIARKAIIAAKRVIARGYEMTETDAMRKTRMLYMESNDACAAFMNRMMVRTNSDIEKQVTKRRLGEFNLSAVHHAFTAWCTKAFGNKAFVCGLDEFKKSVIQYVSNTTGAKPDEVICKGERGMYISGYYPNWQAWELYDLAVVDKYACMKPLVFVTNSEGTAVGLLDYDDRHRELVWMGGTEPRMFDPYGEKGIEIPKDIEIQIPTA